MVVAVIGVISSVPSPTFSCTVSSMCVVASMIMTSVCVEASVSVVLSVSVAVSLYIVSSVCVVASLNVRVDVDEDVVEVEVEASTLGMVPREGAAGCLGQHPGKIGERLRFGVAHHARLGYEVGVGLPQRFRVGNPFVPRHSAGELLWRLG